MNTNSNQQFFKKRFNLDQSTYLSIALSKKFFSRPTNEELFYETNSDTSFTLYFEHSYYIKLKSEFQRAYNSGSLTKSTTANQWNDLKIAIDSAENITLINSLTLKPYLSNLIENTTPLTRTIIFNSNKISISEDLFDFSPKKIDKNYHIEVHLSENDIQIKFTDISTNTFSIIENLVNSTIGEGGMILNNEKHMIMLDWNKPNSQINRIVVNLKEEESRMTYYNELT